MRATERATRSGSSGSFHVGLPVLTLQNPQRRVHVSPRIMNVAVPRSQQSPMFGQAASLQTVCRPSSAIVFDSSRYFALPGRGTLNQAGLRERNGSTSSPMILRTSMPPGFARDRVWWIAQDWGLFAHVIDGIGGSGTVSRTISARSTPTSDSSSRVSGVAP